MINKEKFPLYNIMTCLLCGNNIIPHFGKEYRYYRCGGYHKKECNSSVIKAEIIEEKIRNIVMENLSILKFFTSANLKFSEDQKKEIIADLQKRKCKHLSSLKDGKLKHLEEDYLIRIEQELREINNEPYFVNFTDKQDEEKFLEKQKKLLLSENNLGVNKLYKTIITVDLNIKKRYGLIHFISLRGDIPYGYRGYYKFSI